MAWAVKLSFTFTKRIFLESNQVLAMPLTYDAVTGTWKVEQGGGGVAITVHSDYDTALADLRSASGVSDGDEYYTAKGGKFNAYVSSGPGILVPSEFYNASMAYSQGASSTDLAYLTTSDSLASITARGWSTNITAAASFIDDPTASASGAWRLEASNTNPSRAYLQFTLGSAGGAVMCIMKGNPVTPTPAIGGIDASQTYFPALNPGPSGARYVHASCYYRPTFITYIGRNVFRIPHSYSSDQNVVPSSLDPYDSYIRTQSGFESQKPTWFVTYLDSTHASGKVFHRTLEIDNNTGGSKITADITDLQTTTGGGTHTIGANRFGVSNIGPVTLDIYEAHIFTL